MQNISNNFPINHEVPAIDKIQRRLYQLKSGKARNNVDLELLIKHVNNYLCFKLFVEWQIAFGQTSISLPFRGIYRLKTIWKGQGSTTDTSKHGRLRIGSTVCKLIINIILERMRPWYEAQPNTELEKNNLFISYLLNFSCIWPHLKWLLDSIRIHIPDGESCLISWENSAKKHLLLTSRVRSHS